MTCVARCGCKYHIRYDADAMIQTFFKKLKLVFYKWSGPVQTQAVHGSGRSTVPHGPHGTVIGGPKFEKSNMSHRWPPRAGPLRVGTVRSGPIYLFFYKFKKL
jgi:hypothetical protein